MNRVNIASKILAVGTTVLTLAACQATPSNSAPLPDSTADLQSRLDSMQPGDTITLDPVVYAHNNVLKIRVPGVHIDGNGGTLQATNDATSSVQILADDVELSDITLTAPPDGPRLGGLDNHKLVVTGSGAKISRVSVSGSAAAGIFVFGAQNFALTDVQVTGSRADGVHITNGSRHGRLSGIKTSRTGDDGVAVVSYQADAVPCDDITISGIDVQGNTHGRGITVVGGTNVTMRDFNVDATSGAGVYVATEAAPYFTRSVDNVSITSGTVTSANVDPDVVHGAILVYAGNPGTTIDNVAISDVNVRDTSATALRNVAVNNDGGAVSRITLDNIALTDTALPPLASSNVPPDSLSTAGWTLDGQQIDAN
jgi:Right handed beta helix region